jgi:creatinine amidohydrolase
MADYYAQHAAGSDPFNWIKIHPLMTKEIIAQYPFDHAGIGETSLMMALCPEAVDMARLNKEEWYSASAEDASKDLGERGVSLILDHMRAVLWG